MGESYKSLRIWGFLVAQWWRICLPSRRHSVDPWVRKIPWRRAWKPTLVFFPGKSHEQRRQAGYSPWGHKRVRHDLETKQQQQCVEKQAWVCGFVIFVNCIVKRNVECWTQKLPVWVSASCFGLKPASHCQGADYQGRLFLFHRYDFHCKFCMFCGLGKQGFFALYLMLIEKQKQKLKQAYTATDLFLALRSDEINVDKFQKVIFQGLFFYYIIFHIVL